MARREAFDPLKRYTVCRDFTFRGKPYKYGQAFEDYSDMRRFRQLYDARFLRMAEWDGPVFSSMSAMALREWLVANGHAGLAHSRATHERLVERCKRVYAAQQKEPVKVAPKAQPQEGKDGIPTRQDDSKGSGQRVQGEAATGTTSTRSVQRRERLGGPS